MWSGGYEEEDDEDESYTESESSGSSEGEAKEFLYLKLELCGKLNLQGWLDNLDTDYKSIAYKLSAMKILEGLASGLAYLHGECNPSFKRAIFKAALLFLPYLKPDFYRDDRYSFK